MARTLTEDYLLLALDPAKGTVAGDGVTTRATVAGAALLELTLAGVLTVQGQGKKAVLVATGPPPADPLRRQVLEMATGRRPKDAVSRIGGARSWKDRAGELRQATLDGLARDGVLRREDSRVLGLFPRTRWWVLDAEAVDEPRRRVSAALATVGPAAGSGDAPPPAEPRTLALVSLLAAAGRLPAVTGLPKAEAARRAEVVTAGDWASPAVRDAVKEVQAILMTSILASTTAATTASSS